VQCSTCGVYLYPADVLKSASANELEPQRAELRLSSGGRLVDVTSAALWRLAHPTDVRAAALTRPAPEARAPAPARSAAPAKVDGAAILAEMLEAAPQAAETPAALQRPGPPSRAPLKIKSILVIMVVIGIALVTAWIFLAGR
jgi:hypothetical protein